LAAKAALTAIQTFTGQQTVQTSAAANKALILKGSASQSATLFEAQDSSSGVWASIGISGSRFGSVGAQGGTYIDSSGNLMVRTGSVTYGQSIANINTAAASFVGLTIRGAASQSADLQQWQASDGSVSARVESNGTIRTTQQLALTGNIVSLSTQNSGGLVTLARSTAASTNPGANFARLYLRDGTTAGTLKLVVRAGAAGAETTILDNIPQ
jgi:hypothetical protein